MNEWPDAITWEQMQLAGTICQDERCREDGLDMRVAVPADVLARVRATFSPESDEAAKELATLIALRAQFDWVATRNMNIRTSLWQRYKGRGCLKKADLAHYARHIGAEVSGWDTKDDLLEKVSQLECPRTTWSAFVAQMERA